MPIRIVKEKDSMCMFRDLRKGDVFKMKKHSESVTLKIPTGILPSGFTFNAVDIESGNVIYLEDGDNVYPVNATMTLE